MKLFRHFVLVPLILSLLLSLGISSGFQSGAVAQIGSECAVTVRPGESIQETIDEAEAMTVICLVEGTWQENIKIDKSLTLQGVGAEHTLVKGVHDGYPVVLIMTPDKVAQIVSVKLKWLTISAADGGCTNWVNGICAHGVLIEGSAQAEIIDSTITDNGYSGIALGGTTYAVINDSTIFRNWHIGIVLRDAAQVTITDSTISMNKFVGLWLEDSAQVEITNSTISGSMYGSWVIDTARAEITDSTISKNGQVGINLGNSMHAEVTDCTISGNLLFGISLGDLVQATIERNRITNNGIYGVVLHQQPCFRTNEIFSGHIIGTANTIPGPGEPDANDEGTVCPSELRFLMTEEGGEYP